VWRSLPPLQVGGAWERDRERVRASDRERDNAREGDRQGGRQAPEDKNELSTKETSANQSDSMGIGETLFL
jgi:hypothetical protein